ncbi:MAG TPA: acetyl-CoA carboxylase biotin carboxyl carrier protein [Candidatus Binatia bacterium]|nr:acetyl-CoA carboxylase biotin carboxyl carrier protein [Candidatus Binatia bacterium]
MAARRPRPDPEGPAPLIEQLRDLAALIVEYGLAEVEVEQAGTRIRVVRERAATAAASPAPEPPGPARTETASAESEASLAHLVKMEAPMVGTFYRAPNPEAAPYVSEGDVVKEGQVICVIEAMKLMNEVEVRVTGRIARILVENAQAVEFGQPLFLIDPRI